MTRKITLGLVGARGYVGSELIRLVAAHPRFELAFVSSREREGQRVADHEPGFTGDLRYVNLDAAAVAGQGVDAVVLALPNGLAAGFVAALDTAAPGTVIYLQCVPVGDAGTAPRMALPASATRSGTLHFPRRRWLQQPSDCAGRSHCEVLVQIICTNRSSSVTEVNPHF